MDYVFVDGSFVGFFDVGGRGSDRPGSRFPTFPLASTDRSAQLPR
jgi:hypothetical protein